MNGFVLLKILNAKNVCKIIDIDHCLVETRHGSIYRLLAIASKEERTSEPGVEIVINWSLGAGTHIAIWLGASEMSDPQIFIKKLAKIWGYQRLWPQEHFTQVFDQFLLEGTVDPDFVEVNDDE